MMAIKMQDATAIALEFLWTDLDVPPEDQDFFAILSSRKSGSEWYVVEIGVEGLPDKWVLQVFDTGACDPCYTFVSPMPSGEDADLLEFPPAIANAIAAERQGGRI